MNSLQDKIYEVTAKIPKGKVSTYGRIAKLAGVKSPRPVGNWLHHNPDPKTIPCHRVVNSQGRLAKNFGAKGKIKTQTARLRQEGVEVMNNRVDLKKYGW